MRAVLIDPGPRTVSMVDFDGGSAALRDFVGQSDLDFAPVGLDRKQHRMTVVVAGDGYFRTDLKWWFLVGYPNPLCGRALIFATDRMGETVDIDLLPTDLSIDWRETRPELPPVTVNDVVVADFNGPDAPKTQAELYERIQKATGQVEFRRYCRAGEGYHKVGEGVSSAAADLRRLAGSRPGVAQAGFVTVSASELEAIAIEADALAREVALLRRESLRRGE